MGITNGNNLSHISSQMIQCYCDSPLPYSIEESLQQLNLSFVDSGRPEEKTNPSINACPEPRKHSLEACRECSQNRLALITIVLFLIYHHIQFDEFLNRRYEWIHALVRQPETNAPPQGPAFAEVSEIHREIAICDIDLRLLDRLGLLND